MEQNQEVQEEGTVVQWREKRGDRLSETLYTGIMIDACGGKFLVAKLSHGRRVMKEDGSQAFGGGAVRIPIPASFVESAFHAYMVDNQFQREFPEFDELVSEALRSVETEPD